MSDHDANKCTFTIRIDACLHEDAFLAPSFRFRFLEGTKKQTPVVGTHGWTSIAESPGTWRFEASIADVLVTEALAGAIDDDPIVAFILSDQGTGASTTAGAGTTSPTAPPKGDTKARPVTAVTTPQNETSARSQRAAATTGRGRLIADVFEMDVSALLQRSCVHLDHTWVERVEVATIRTGDDDDDGENASFFSRRAASQRREQHSRSVFTPASGIRSVSIHVSVDQPLLSAPLHAKLNPLTLALGSARRMPGINAARAAVGEDPHSALARCCRPVYIQWRFFSDRALYTSKRTRFTLSHGRDHAETIHWQQATTILAGRCHPQELYDAIQTGSLAVEIHDRDVALDDAPLLKLHKKWESLHTTGIDPTSTAPAGVLPSSTSASRTSTPRGTPPTKPLDAFAVDEIAKSDWRALMARAGEHFAYGEAVFRLNELLEKAKVLSAPASDDDAKPYMQLKLTADVMARKRRAQPLGAAALAESDDSVPPSSQQSSDPTAISKLSREPGGYVAHSTSLSVHVTLERAIVRTKVPTDTSPARFARFVLLFPYNDSAMLQRVMRVVEGTNLRALPEGIPIRSYQMTPQEKLACATGDLDVITGCMVIDTDTRTIVLEGLADHGMKAVLTALPRTQPQSASFRMFANDQLRFTQRLYTDFEVDLKRIKLRYALPVLLNMPDIYMRTKVSEACYGALTRLMELRRVSRLADVKELDLFPSAAMLLEVESKYGESISLEDIYGKPRGGAGAASAATVATPHEGDAADSCEPATEDPSTEPSPNTTRHSPKRTHLKAPTDATNPQFDEHRRTRAAKDFIETRKKESDAQRQAYEHKKQQETPTESTGPVYIYSGQKLRSQDALQEELRKTLSSDHRATYTYGPEFQSLVMSLVNPEELRQTEEREAKKKWTTQRGFVYPMPRPTSEYYKHPDAPSEARCEDLRMPFIDNINHPKPVSRDNNRGSDPRAEFSTLPSKDMVFGGTNGDGTVNHDYFKSVHLCGEGLRKEMEEALEKEQADWERKLVVDRKQIKFLAHGNICSQPSTHSHPSQLDKLRDILNGPVRSKPLRIVRHATLPSGKLVPLRPPPASITSLQEYAGPVAATFAGTLRHDDNGTPFLATDATTGKPKDFHFPSVSDLLTPPVKKATTYKEIRPVPAHAKHGFLWGNSNQ